ncbi:hypothetical protein [Thermus islandicus]|uniref:hypothetical protein n=1 Tax=Thermus islandicus TaxID=540988 RepID=UPI0004259051|nr:hypothetical protein [Thermus islandicus]
MDARTSLTLRSTLGPAATILTLGHGGKTLPTGHADCDGELLRHQTPEEILRDHLYPEREGIDAALECAAFLAD